MARDSEGVVRRGDFLIPKTELREAEDAYQERSQGSRTRDNATRAPIAPDLETWKGNQRGLDYPGVDTPTDRPRQAFFDAPLPGDTATDDGIGLVTEPVESSTSEMFEEHDTSMDNLADAVDDVLNPL